VSRKSGSTPPTGRCWPRCYDDILTAFTPYRPVGLTAKNAAANLHAKLDDAEFCTDLDLLVNTWPDGYDVPQAADLVIDRPHSRL
jgi:hypothetical protein